MTRLGRDERGSATVLVLTMTVALAFLAVLGVTGSSLLLAHRRAATAADLAALAGAAALQRGEAGCPAAGRVAEANGGRVVTCHVEGDQVVVRAQHEATLPWHVKRAVSAAARAGPVG